MLPSWCRRPSDVESAIHFALLVVWIVLLVPTFLWWRESIVWLVFMSIYAIIATHWGSWAASRAKRAAQDAANGGE